MASGVFPLKGLLAYGSTRTKFLLAALLLFLVWTLGPRSIDSTPSSAQKSTLDTLKGLASAAKSAALPSSGTAGGGGGALTSPSPADWFLSYDAAETFCFHYHLEAYNGSLSSSSLSSSSSSSSSSDLDGYHAHHQHQGPPPTANSGRNTRRIYDLLLITPTTSPEMLELRLASMYAYVDYFILLEVPPPPSSSSATTNKDSSSSSSSRLYGEPPDDNDAPTMLDTLWDRLLPYHSRLIRHTLSALAHDLKPGGGGRDHAATTRNALYTRVIPLLTGAHRVRRGDVLLIADVEELVRPVTLAVLRNCRVPARTTVRTRKYWYGFQWMKIDGLGTTPSSSSSPGEAAGDPTDAPDHHHYDPDGGAAHQGNEWWPHPQATVFQGADTPLPDELRSGQRARDEYVFGDGGWTCHLCYASIAETLAKMGEAGVIWFDGPRWKAAGRVVLRIMKGIDMYDRTHLARIQDNPDLPAPLASSPERYQWLLDRDALGAHFGDFAAADLERYLAHQKQVDAEPDFERPRPGIDYVLESTGEGSSSEAEQPPPPPPPAAVGSGAGPSVEPPVSDADPPPRQETDWRNAPLHFVVNDSSGDEDGDKDQDEPSTASVEERDGPSEGGRASGPREAIAEAGEGDEDAPRHGTETSYRAWKQ